MPLRNTSSAPRRSISAARRLRNCSLHRGAVVLLELLPFLRLRGQDEIHHVTRQQAKRAVIVLGPALAIAARVALRGGLEQAGLDGLLKASLRNVRAHAAPSRTSILPVTAAEMRAVRYP